MGVGIFNTLLDFSFYTLLTLILLKDNIAVAGLVSGTFALLCAFTTHGLITWRGSHLDRQTLLRFFLFTGLGMWVIRPLLLAAFINLSGLYEWAHSITTALGLPFSRDFVRNTGSFGLMLVIVLTYNYFVYERFVFKKSNRIGQESRLES